MHCAIDYDALTLQHLHVDPKVRMLRQCHESKVWDDMLQHGWVMANHHTEKRFLRSEHNFTTNESFEMTHTEQDVMHPFLLCSSYPGQSGYFRLQRILSAFNASIIMSQTVHNTEESSCFVIITRSGTPAARTNAANLMDNVTFGPLVDVLKFAPGTPTNILNDHDWMKPLETINLSLHSDIPSFKVEQEEQRLNNWTRSIMIDLVPGSNVGMKSGNEDIESIARKIMEYVASMVSVEPAVELDQIPPKRRSIGTEKVLSKALST
ncbi:hypothetical protein HJC23_011850 [Cyclotella cryptica]|uniref:Uncharacterized protein n=1 Tax=Cyclotella cryptica TaxID=29204 RepID=A0ABD3QGC1_9STRA